MGPIMFKYLRAGAVAAMLATGAVSAETATPKYLNTDLIDATRDFVPSSTPDYVEDLPTYGETVRLAPQNRGVVLYADDNFAIYNRANASLPSRKGKMSRLAVETPVCETMTYGDITGARQPTKVLLPSMTVTIVLNKPPSFEVSSRWLLGNVRPVVDEYIAGRFCGGEVAVVNFSIWYAGLQHTGTGEIITISDFEYPTFTVGDRRKQSFILKDLRGPSSEQVWVKPFDSGFVYGWFQFWDAVGPADQTSLRVLGHANEAGFFMPKTGPQRPSMGSTREAFNAYIAYGQPSYNPDGSIKDLYEPWKSLSYTEYAWHVAMSHKRRLAIEAHDEASRMFFRAIAEVQRSNYCEGNDLEWWEWNAWTVAQRQKSDFCTKGFQ